MSHLSPIPSSPFKQSRSTPIQSPRSNGVPIIQQSPYGFGPTSAMTLSTSPPVSDMFPQDVTHDDSQDNNRVFSDSYSTGTSPARNIGRDDGDFIGSPDPDDQNFVFVATSPGGPLQPDNALESTAVMKGNEDVGCSCEDCIIAGVGLDPVKRQLPRRCLVVFDDVQEGGIILSIVSFHLISAQENLRSPICTATPQGFNRPLPCGWCIKLLPVEINAKMCLETWLLFELLAFPN